MIIILEEDHKDNYLFLIISFIIKITIDIAYLMKIYLMTGIWIYSLELIINIDKLKTIIIDKFIRLKARI